MVTLFFVEAVMVGLVASFAGWLVGFLGAFIQNGVSVGFHRTAQSIGLAHACELMGGCVIVGAVITLIATIAPAGRAAVMPAAAALRTEV